MPGGRVHRAARSAGRWSVNGSSRTRLVRKVAFTGSTRVGKSDHARLRRPGEALHARARRQEREHRLRRRRRRRCGRRGSTGRGLRQRRAGLLRPVADPRAEQRCATSSWSGSRLRWTPSWWATRPTRDTQMGPLISAGQRSRGCRATSTAPTWRSPVQVPDGPGFWVSPTVVLAESTSAAGLARGGLRAGGRGAGVRGRGRGGRARERQRLRPVRLDLRPRRGPRAARRPGRSRRAI